MNSLERRLIILLTLLVYCCNSNAQLSCNDWLKMANPLDAMSVGDLDISGNKLTVEAFFNRSVPYSPANDHRYSGDIVSKHLNPSDCNYLLRPTHCEITTTNGFFSTISACDIQFNKTYHVAMVYDGTKLRFYRNGYLISEINATGNLITNDWLTTIGDIAGFPKPALAENLKGFINEVRFWQVAKSQFELRSAMNGPLINPTSQAGLLAYYKFGSLQNLQGNNAWNGTLIANATINATNTACDFVADSCQIFPECPLDFWYKQDDCNPLKFQFFSSDSSRSLSWNFGDGSAVSTIKNPVHVFGEPANYKIQVVQSGACFALIEKTISVVVQSADIIRNKDSIICKNGTVQLNAESALSYCWSPATFLNNTSIGNPVATPLSDITYYLNSKSAGTNLIVNGNFSAGNSGFTSDYVFANPNVTEGQYFVGTNPRAWNAALSSCADHSSGTGNMLLVNGSPTADVKVWSQIVAVTPNTNYEFSTWIQALWTPNPAKLQFSINGVILGNVITASLPTCTWTSFNTNWNSGTATSAVISIVNKNTEVQGNDFALDDISFSPVVYKRDSVKIVVEKPIVKASNDTTVCPGSIISLSAIGANNFSWSPALGLSNPLVQSPIATIANKVTYTVTGTSASGCTAKDSITISTLPVPSVNISSDTSLCDISPVPLNASGGISYKWTPANSLNNPFIANPIATPSISTLYKVIVEGSNGCFATDSVSIAIAQKPNIILSKDTSICTNGTAQLEASGGVLYKWTPTVGLSDPTIYNPIASPIANTKYTVKVTNLAGCSAEESLMLSVLPAPVITVSKDTSICSGTGASLLVTGANSYSWAPAMGLNNNLIPNPIARPSANTSYVVTATGGNRCSVLDSVKVTILESPIARIIPDTAICNNSNIELYVSGGVSYKWFPTTSLSNPAIANPIASPSTATKYYVEVKDNYGCAFMDSVSVSIYQPAEMGVKSADVSGCVGAKVQLEAYGGTQYQWSPGTGLSNAQVANPLVTITTSQQYQVTVKESICNTQAIYPVVVNVKPITPVVLSKSNDITCNTPTAFLNVSNGGSSFSWSPSIGLSATNVSNPVASPLATTTYSVAVQSINGCISKGSIELKVINNSDFRLFQLPNAFTPNGDGKNDCFGVTKWGQVSIVYFEIYNRWGQQIFNGKNAGICWDGNFKGIKQPSGNYIYKLMVETMCGMVERKGSVILIR